MTRLPLASLLILSACVTQAQYDTTLQDLERAKSERKACDDRLAELEGQLQSELSATKEELEELRKQRAAVDEQFADLTSKLQSLIDAGDLEVYMRRGLIMIGLPSQVLFPSGKAELSERGQKALARIATVIAEMPDRRLQVAGHTDNVKYPPGGPFGDNWGLSLARSRRVTIFLTDDKKADPKKKGDTGGGGLNPRRWSAAGYAEFDPIAGTVEQQAKADQEKNRRVELVVQPNVEEMLNLSNIK